MKSSKRLWLAVLVSALSLFAVSASAASAAVWKDKGVNVSKHVTFNLTGGEVFDTGTGGMSCEVLATITTSGGSTGSISKWEVKNCGGAFGDLASCQILATEPKNLPWAIDVNTTDLTITSMRLRRTFKNGCAIKEVDKTVTSTTMTLNTPSEITEVEFLGINGEYEAFGSMTVDSPNSGTYGIG